MGNWSCYCFRISLQVSIPSLSFLQLNAPASWLIGGSRGALIVCNYPGSTQAKGVEKVLEAIRKYGGSASIDRFAVKADLLIIKGLRHLVNKAIKHISTKKINILIKKASITIIKPMTKITLRR